MKDKISKLNQNTEIEKPKNKKLKQTKSTYIDYINFIYTREDEKQWIPVQKQ